MPAGTTTDPQRMDLKTAARVLGITYEGVRGLLDAGILESIRPYGRGRGKRRYVRPGEVQAFVDGGSEGAKAYREKQSKRKK